MSRREGAGRPGQGRRVALLIGVPHYKSDDFPKIPTVANDLHQLRLVLESSGYDVEVYPEDADSQEPSDSLVTGALIADQLQTACDEAPADGVLFIYFSGHGMSIDGRDYLVPGDIASEAVAIKHRQYLVDADFSGYLDKCAARAVIFAVDACRENMNPAKGFRLGASSGFGSGVIDSRYKTRLAVVYGCDREQFCYFSEELRMSLFTKALCTVLSPDHPAQTLADVVAETDKVLGSLIDRYRKGRVQQVHALHETGVGSIERQVICEGSAYPWLSAVRDSTLWTLVAGAAEQEVDRLRSAAEGVVGDAWKYWQAAAGELAEDPWRDPDYPVRCLEALAELIPSAAHLSAVEALICTTAPFLAEMVQVEAVRRLLPHDPLDLTPGLTADPLRQELEAVHLAHSRMRDKAVALAKTQPTEAAAVATWLVHRHAFRQVRMWEDTPVVELAGRLAEAADRRAGFRNECARAVRGIASLLGTGAEELTAFLQGGVEGVRSAVAKVSTTELHDGKRAKVRGRELAALLSLAGMLALDPRRMGTVVVDHIGIRDALDPVDLRRAAREADWVLDDDRTAIGLVARCVHPAIHLALEEVCTATQQQLQAIHRWAREAGRDHELTAALPVSVGTDELAPELDKAGRMVYETPLLQFRLAHNEVRDLLMGVRLYGDPALAVRELYQNALDACRYRRVRAAYRKRDYEGRIRITNGVEDGRPYIECVDNGVGMGRGELETTFSRAGRRFVTSTTFLWEQAEWLRRDESLRLWPNSQFGIGVFSYFMLADEIFVETAQADPVTDAPGTLLHVRISSSGSLFRITTADGTGVREDDIAASGGTRVRLYLRGSADGGMSCVDILERLVWYSEFDVEAVAGDIRRRWSPGRLNMPRAVGWVKNVAPDVWWVEGNGALLADGIAANATPYGYVVNLCKQNRPTLSVDRNTLEDFNKSWIQDQLRAATTNLHALAELDFLWLQNFAMEEPVIAQHALAELRSRDASLPADRRRGRQESVRVCEVGVWPGDLSLLFDYSRVIGARRPRDEYGWNIGKNHVEASRRRAWMEVGSVSLNPVSDFGSSYSYTADEIWVLPSDVRGHPQLEPLDYAVTTRGDGRNDLKNILELGRNCGIRLSELVRRIRRFIIHGGDAPPDLGERLDFVPSNSDIRIAQSEPLETGPLLVAALESYRTGHPLADMIARVNVFVDLGHFHRSITCSADPAYICDERDVAPLRAASRWLGTGANHLPWLGLLLDPNIDAQCVDDLMRILNVPAARLHEIADAARGDNVLAKLLSVRVDSAKPWLRGGVSGTHLLVAATLVHSSPAQVAELIAPYQDILGFWLPTETVAPPDQPLPDETIAVLQELAESVVTLPNGSHDADERPFQAHVPMIARVSFVLGIDAQTVVHTLAPFRKYLPMDLPDDVTQVPPRQATEQEIRVLGHAFDAKDHCTSSAQLIDTARRLGTTVNAVREITDRWLLPMRGGMAPESAFPLRSPFRNENTATYSEDKLSLLDSADRRVLSRQGFGDDFLQGTLPMLHIVKSAVSNNETIGKTLERVARLAQTFPISAPPVDWGDLIDMQLPPQLHMVDYGSLNATEVVGIARSAGCTVAEILRKFRPVAEAFALPELGEEEVGRLDIVPDAYDLVAIAPLRQRFGTRYRHDAVHVLRVAARLGQSIGEINKRVAKFEVLLSSAPPPITPEVESHVPDWRDLVILTAELNGRAPITDNDLRNGHVERATREAELPVEEVRNRLERYAAYVGYHMEADATRDT